MRNDYKKGFSLIELLISLTILVFLLTTSLILYGKIYNMLSRNFSPIPQNLVRFWKLKESIESTLTYITTEGEELEEFFKANSNELYYVSNYSTCNLHPPVLCHIYKKEDKLVISEIQVYSSNVNYLTLEHKKDEKRELILFSDVKDIYIKIVERKLKNNREAKIPVYIKFLIKFKNENQYSFTFKIRAYDPNKLPLSRLLLSNIPI